MSHDSIDLEPRRSGQSSNSTFWLLVTTLGMAVGALSAICVVLALMLGQGLSKTIDKIPSVQVAVAPVDNCATVEKEPAKISFKNPLIGEREEVKEDAKPESPASQPTPTRATTPSTGDVASKPALDTSTDGSSGGTSFSPSFSLTLNITGATPATKPAADATAVPKKNTADESTPAKEMTESPQAPVVKPTTQPEETDKVVEPPDVLVAAKSIPTVTLLVVNNVNNEQHLMWSVPVDTFSLDEVTGKITVLDKDFFMGYEDLEPIIDNSTVLRSEFDFTSKKDMDTVVKLIPIDKKKSGGATMVLEVQKKVVFRRAAKKNDGTIEHQLVIQHDNKWTPFLGYGIR